MSWKDIGRLETLFFDLSRLVSDWLWQVDRNGRIVWISERIFKVLGVHPAEVEGLSFTDIGAFVNASDQPVDPPDFRKPFRDRRFVIRDDSADNRYHLVSGVPVFDEETQQYIGARGAARDITQQIAAEAKLRAAYAEMEELVRERTRELRAEIAERAHDQESLRDRNVVLNAVIEGSKDAVFVKDCDGRHLLANRAAAAIAGLVPQDLLGKTDADVFAPESAETVMANDRLVVETGDVFDGEETVVIGDKTRVLQVYKAPYRDANGAVIGVIGIARDVTGQRKAEERLRHTQKMEAIGQLTGGVAHDFNNLLQVVQTNLELARIRTPDDPMTTAILDAASEAVENGARLTQQLLAFSRKQTLLPQTLDANDLVIRTTGMVSRTLGEDIEIETALEADLPPLTIDPHELENCIVNVALNARAAMPDGGTLMVRTARHRIVADLETREGILAAGDYVRISLTDTGCGMPPEVLERAFEPFFTTKDVGNGSGLGLSMVYGFAVQSGGMAFLESVEGEGTTVTILLPVPRPAPPARAADHDAGGALGGGKVLVVEDDPGVRASAAMLLETFGYEVRTAEHAQAALRVLDAEPDIDILFSDVIMPKGMNGLDLAREATRRHAALKVLIVSGYPETDLRKAGLDNDRFAVLNKPYSIAELSNALREVENA